VPEQFFFDVVSSDRDGKGTFFPPFLMIAGNVYQFFLFFSFFSSSWVTVFVELISF